MFQRIFGAKSIACNELLLDPLTKRDEGGASRPAIDSTGSDNMINSHKPLCFWIVINQ